MGWESMGEYWSGAVWRFCLGTSKKSAHTATTHLQPSITFQCNVQRHVSNTPFSVSLGYPFVPHRVRRIRLRRVTPRAMCARAGSGPERSRLVPVTQLESVSMRGAPRVAWGCEQIRWRRGVGRWSQTAECRRVWTSRSLGRERLAPIVGACARAVPGALVMPGLKRQPSLCPESASAWHTALRCFPWLPDEQPIRWDRPANDPGSPRSYRSIAPLTLAGHVTISAVEPARRSQPDGSQVR
jgi:hypothetical protein